MSNFPTFKRDRAAKKRYGIYYFHIVGSFAKQDTSGSTDSLASAYGHAARHCAMSELVDGEYAQALVIDRKQGRILRSYRRAAGGNIVTKEF